MSEQEISVDQQMEDEEEMQTTPTSSLSGSAPTSVIVSVTGDGTMVDSDSDKSANQSPSHSPQFPVFDLNTQRMLNSRLQVRHTISDPSLKAKHRQKYGQRLSPIPRRHELVKTYSVGASVDTAGTSPPPWKPIAVESTSPRSPTNIMDSSSEASEHPTTVTSTPTPSSTLPGGTVTAAMLPALGVQSGSWVTAQGLIPSQEQLEAMHKKQIEMLAIWEQQKQSGGTGPEMFQFPLALWAFGGQPTAAQLGQIQAMSLPTTTTNSSAAPAPSPTPSNSSTDSGVSSMSGMSLSGETLTLAPQRRPLSESLSAPGFQSPVTNAQYEGMMKQFQMQHQHILLQQQQLYQHYMEQQHKLMQQAMLERKHFEEQQRQLAGMHLRQQQQLQKQQTLLRQMQEQQVVQLQRQQQMILLQTMGIQQQHQQNTHFSQSAGKQTPLRRMVAAKDTTIRLPYSGKPMLTATSSSGSSQEGASGSEMGSTLSIERRSPSLTPKASLTPTNSLDSTNGRTSPHVGMASPSPIQEPVQQGGTGLVYDTMMLKHSCSCGGSHPEHPGRLQSIWARLHETRVVQSCQRLRARKASLAELQSIHSENHVRLYGRPSQKKPGQDKKDPSRAFIQLSCGGVGVDQDTYWNDAHTSNASRMAAGSVIELADKVVSGEIKNGFAFIRPPGHHSLPNQAMAFCYFNNVALAAKAMMAKNKRVMLVDWDIHHGNGTQQIFYDNPAVLYLSLHRYDNGTFFPGTGRAEEIGSGAGLGFNVNIAFSGSQNFQGMSVSNFGDPEYLAAFRTVVVPIAQEFNPDLILVSAGFNATEGHPPTLGGYSVTPTCFAHMTRMLMGVGSGRVAMALEGGYELMSLCASAESCMKALLGAELAPLDSSSVDRHPHGSAISCIEKTVAYHKSYWPSLARSSALLPLSHSEAERKEMEADTVSALASLSVGGSRQQRPMQSMSTAV